MFSEDELTILKIIKENKETTDCIAFNDVLLSVIDKLKKEGYIYRPVGKAGYSLTYNGKEAFESAVNLV